MIWTDRRWRRSGLESGSITSKLWPSWFRQLVSLFTSSLSKYRLKQNSATYYFLLNPHLPEDASPGPEVWRSLRAEFWLCHNAFCFASPSASSCWQLCTTKQKTDKNSQFCTLSLLIVSDLSVTHMKTKCYINRAELKISYHLKLFKFEILNNIILFRLLIWHFRLPTTWQTFC